MEVSDEIQCRFGTKGCTVVKKDGFVCEGKCIGLTDRCDIHQHILELTNVQLPFELIKKIGDYCDPFTQSFMRLMSKCWLGVYRPIIKVDLTDRKNLYYSTSAQKMENLSLSHISKQKHKTVLIRGWAYILTECNIRIIKHDTPQSSIGINVPMDIIRRVWEGWDDQTNYPTDFGVYEGRSVYKIERKNDFIRFASKIDGRFSVKFNRSEVERLYRLVLNYES